MKFLHYLFRGIHDYYKRDHSVRCIDKRDVGILAEINVFLQM